MKSLKPLHFHFISLILIQIISIVPCSSGAQEIPSLKKQYHFPTQISLCGIIISEESPSSLAVFKNEKTDKITILKTGESIYDLKLTHVLNDRVTLQRKNKTIHIFFGRSHSIETWKMALKKTDETQSKDQKDKINEQQKETFITKEFIKSEVEKQLKADWSKIIHEARLAPNQINGKIAGLKITKLPGKSILSQMGIQKNDIIREVNNIKLNNKTNLFELYNKYKDANQIKALIERQGKLFHVLYILK